MKRDLKKIFCAALTLLLCLAGKAQTAEWLVAPQYSEIKYFAPKMYKVTKDRKVGILSADGKVVLPVQYDAINLFYENRAVFVNRTPKGWQLKGVLSDDGTVHYAEGDYYLLPKYMFYSDGLLPVRDSNGFSGFLDEMCRPAFEFTADEVHPFSEGFAVVGNGETFRWVNTVGEQVLPYLSNGGTPYGGTNFHDGKAYLWDEDGVFFVLTDDGKTKRVPARELEVDYLFRVDTEFGDEVPYTQYEPAYDSDWTPEQRDGKWSLVSARGNLLSPFVYDHVGKFADGAAIAEMEGKYGLLCVAEDNSTFYTKVTKTRHIFSSATSCNCEFTLAVPAKWQGQDLRVSVKDATTGNAVNLTDRGGSRYSFAYRPQAQRASERKTFDIEVRNNGALLWKGKETYTFEQMAKLQASIRVSNADATSNDRCYVTATIRNPSGVSITTSVKLSGGGNKARFDPKTVTLTIPPHSSRTVGSSFFVKNVELNGWCSVSTSDGASARKGNLELKPF